MCHWKVKGQSKGNKHLRPKSVGIWEAVIQKKTQTVFWLEAKKHLWERESEQLRQWKEGISTGADRLTNGTNSKEHF